ncbi:hypothetical protein Acor_06260 [Acrocarpospora corrugata]|uniref:HTH tetR-type domain-containing protein n=1 Tax=Acrocarpospora corrugata TaxID=35763 RepID=A0A5M3VP48_9ACTN|nr:TetR/AcrR family transcriptional regulator [Acrocarpospora corrugata]GER98564.1 hypothetical protein Acor_06260 [Acrocarpospora corrugata]
MVGCLFGNLALELSSQAADVQSRLQEIFDAQIDLIEQVVAATPPPLGGGRQAAARDRILAAADRLLYGEGIRAVGIDRIFAEAPVTRATFYRHFATKDDLVAAYLVGRSAKEREQVAALRATMSGDAPQMLRTLLTALIAESCGPGARGCPFINAAAEYADPAHPVRRAVTEHRRWFHSQMSRLAAELGHPEPDRVADQLMLLRDGVMVGGYLDDPARAGAALTAAATAIVTHRDGS